MAHTLGLTGARTSSGSNPHVTDALVLTALDTVLVLLLKYGESTPRVGSAPTLLGKPLSSAFAAQFAAASPECGVEFWYMTSLEYGGLLPVGSVTVSVPNTDVGTIITRLMTGRAKAGGQSRFDVANGSNNTSTNPNPGSVTTTQDGCIGFSVAADGSTSFNTATASAGTLIAATDDGQHGGAESYHLQGSRGAVNLGFTHTGNEDWGCIAAYFREVEPVKLNNYLFRKF